MATGPRGKGSKISVIVEAHGLPVGEVLAPANRNDLTLVEPVLSETLKRLPKPHHIIADGEYSSRPLTVHLKKHFGIILTAPPRRHYVNFFHDGRTLRRKKRRWKVERCFSWIRGHKRLECRWEKNAENYLGFVRLSCARILWRRLVIYG